MSVYLDIEAGKHRNLNRKTRNRNRNRNSASRGATNICVACMCCRSERL